MSFKILTQLQHLLSTVSFLIAFLTQHLGKIWTNPNVGLKCNLKLTQLQLSLLTVSFLITFVTQHLGKIWTNPNVGLKM